MGVSEHESPFFPLDEETVARWCANLDVSERTKSAYQLGLRSYCDYLSLTGLSFDDAQTEDVLSFKDWLSNERHLSPASVSNYLSGVRSFYRFAAAGGNDDVAASVKGEPMSRDFKKDALSPSEAAAMLAAMERDTPAGKRDFALVNLMVRTGLRDIEAAGADVGDIRKSGEADVLRIKGKGRREKDAFVVLYPAALAPIREYLAEVRPGAKSREPLFTSLSNNNKGGRLTTRAISGIAKAAMRRIGIDDDRHTAHSLRHTAVTLALLGGASEREAQAMARHADLSTTMIYSHNLDRVNNAAEGAVDALLAERQAARQAD